MHSIKPSKFLMGMAIGLLVATALYVNDKEDTSRINNQKNLELPQSISPDDSRGYNFHTRGSYHNYSDEEIRMIREKIDFEHGGLYYLKTPGRHVPSYQGDFETRLEDYIEENYEDLIDKYKN